MTSASAVQDGRSIQIDPVQAALPADLGELQLPLGPAQGGTEQEHSGRDHEEDPGAVLRGLRVVLRPPRPEDRADRLALGRNPDIIRMFGTDPASLPPLTEADAARWVQGLAEHPHAWVVEHERRQLGEVRLDGVDMQDKRARLAIGLFDPSKLGMGLGREAICLVLGYAFGVLGLHRVGLRVVAYNERAIRCYRACGFVEEGREREAALVGTEWHDDVMMGVLACEFLHIRGASGG